MTRLVLVALAFAVLAALLIFLADTSTDDTVHVRSKSTSQPSPSLPDNFEPGRVAVLQTAGKDNATAAHLNAARAKTKRVRPPRSAHGGAAYPTDELLHDLAMCETGGTMDQRIVSKNGLWFSFFQWTIGTYHGIGGVGDQRDQGYEYQANLARKLILAPGKGWGHFPRCSRQIGAR